MYVWPDDLVGAIVDRLTNDPAKPADLSVFDHEVLPIRPEEVPPMGVIAVYLTEDDAGDDPGDSPVASRLAKVRIEIRVPKVHLIYGTRALRAYVINTVLSDPQQGGLASDTRFQGYRPFLTEGNSNLAGADLEFHIDYFFDTSSS